MNAPIMLNAPTIQRLPKTFKQETSEYIDAINHFLEEHGDGIDIPHQYKLEQVQETLEEIVGYLF